MKGLNQFGRKTDRQDEACDLASITSTVLSIVNSGPTSGLRIETVFSAPSLIMKGNTGKLHQVLLNLFQQAIDDMQGEGLLRITAGRNEREINLILESDTGKGSSDPIPLRRTSNRKTSLRMYIIHRIIREHNGTLMVMPETSGKKYWEVRFHAPDA